jgi:hypothetical protein
MKLKIAFAACAASIAAMAAIVKNHVPETMDGVRPIYAKATTKNHVVIVNVNHAVPDAIWPLAVNYAASKLQLNIATNILEKSIVPELVKDTKALQRTFGEKAIVGVFIENNAQGPAFLTAQGAWAMVNVRSLTRDKPDAQTLRDRYAKMILKGLGHACGGGASLDSSCALFYGSFSLQGMDRTAITICPQTYFPMLENLRAIGGGDITSPYIPE